MFVLFFFFVCVHIMSLNISYSMKNHIKHIYIQKQLDSCSELIVIVISNVIDNVLLPIRQLKGVVERLASCQCQRDQTEARLSEVQKQTSSLPQLFPWPGLGERRQAVEQARNQSTALAPVLSDLRTQVNTSQDRKFNDMFSEDY